MNRLRFLRMKKGISLRDLAEKTNISYPTLSRLENGSSGFNEESLKILSSFFDVSIDYLLERTNDPRGSSYSSSDNKVHIDDFTFALYGEVKDLTDAEKEDILDLVKKMKEIMRKK